MRRDTTPARRTLPSGTLTFLFADMEGSTRLLRDLGDDYRLTLDLYQAIFRRQIERTGGHEIATEGDSFFVVFEQATDAVRCAMGAQVEILEAEWPRGRPLRVRVGIHSGYATEQDGNYVGMAVHEAARVASVTNGGQTIVSLATHALAAASAPPDVEFRDLGAHRMKDIDEPIRLFEVVTPGIDAGPPPNSLNDRSSLPTEVTPFTGRHIEIEEVVKLIADPKTRVVSLTGTGGTGKSRLAIRVASEARGTFGDGVWFVPLSSLTSHDGVASAVAQTIGAVETETRTATAAVYEELSSKHALLVLDNFEHVLEAASFVAKLIVAAPGCTVLVTSREPLRLSAERVYPVPPMALPGPTDPLESIATNDAVALFVDRAKARDPNFAIDGNNASVIAEICRKLDGLPLAIELAAARVGVLGPQGLLDALSEGLGVLVGGPDDAPERHRTLDAAIGWSYDLLSDHLRDVFARASVFHGGFDGEAAAAVCGASSDDLASLVDRSLIRRDASPVRPRYDMLETIRRFAAIKLDASGATVDTQAAHADHYKRFAIDAQQRFHTADAAAWLDRLAADHDNLRAALDHYDARDATPEFTAMSAALMEFWSIRGHLEEGGKRLEHAVERASAGTAARASVIVALARFKRPSVTGQVPKRLLPLVEEAYDIATDVDDPATRAWALVLIAPHSTGSATSRFAAGLLHESSDGRVEGPSEERDDPSGKKRKKEKKPSPAELFQRALPLAEQAGDVLLVAEIKASPWMQKGLGFFRAMSGNPRTLGASLDDALARGDNRTAAELLLRRSFGNLDEREKAARQALELSREIGDRGLQANALKRLGDIGTRKRDFGSALTHLHEALEIARSDNDAKTEASILNELFFIGGHGGKEDDLDAVTKRIADIADGPEGWVSKFRPLLWRGSLPGRRTIVAGAVWALAFPFTHGTLRSALLLASGLVLAGRLRDLRERMLRRSREYSRTTPGLLFVAIAFGTGLLFESVSVASILLFVLLLMRGRMTGRFGFLIAIPLFVAGVVLATRPVTPVAPVFALAWVGLFAFLAQRPFAAHLPWLVFRLAEAVVRSGAAFVGMDAVASWSSGGRFDFGVWGDVGAVAAVGGLVVAAFAAAVGDARLRPGALAVAAASALLPYAFGGGDEPLPLAAGAAFGLGWVLIGTIRAIEGPLPLDIYPERLRVETGNRPATGGAPVRPA